MGEQELGQREARASMDNVSAGLSKGVWFCYNTRG